MGMGKKQALTEFHRGAILAAAERLFAEKGTEKTTMDDIAREAEYSKATLYVYFQSKEEIVNAILLSGILLLQKRIEGAVQSCSDWFQAYYAVCEAVIHFYGENPTTYSAASGELEAAAAGNRGIQDILKTISEIDAVLTGFLERGLQTGAIQFDLPVREVAQLFWAALSGMVRAAEREKDCLGQIDGLDRETFLRHGAQMLLNAIVKR